MKIKITETQLKKQLENTIHVVKIANVIEGTSEIKGTKYFACKFENDFGIHTERFYNTSNSLSIIMNLFFVCGLPTEANTILDTDKLIGKELIIKIDDTTYISYQTGEIVKRQKIVEFQKALSLNDI